MIVRSLRAELFALRRRPGVWILAAVWSVQIVVFAYLSFYLAYRATGPEMPAAEARDMLVALLPESSAGKILGSMPLYGGPVMLMIGALVGSGDYRWGTLRTLLSRFPGRASFLLGRFLAVTMVMAAIAGYTLVLSVLCSLGVAAAESAAVRWPSLSSFAVSFAALWLVATVWAAVGFALGTVTRAMAVAVGVGLVWTMAVENAVGGLAYVVPAFEAVQRGMLSVASGGLAAARGARTLSDGGAPGVTDLLGGPAAAAVLAGYLAVCLVVSFVTFGRRDVP